MSATPEELFDESVSQNLPAPTPIANAIRAVRQKKTQLSAEHHEYLRQTHADEIAARQALADLLKAFEEARIDFTQRIEETQATANIAIGGTQNFVNFLTKSYELAPGDKIEFETGAIIRQAPPE